MSYTGKPGHADIVLLNKGIVCKSRTWDLSRQAFGFVAVIAERLFARGDARCESGSLELL